MYEGCFIQAKFSKKINLLFEQVFFYLRPSIFFFRTRRQSFEKLGSGFEVLQENQKFLQEFEKLR